MWSVVSKAVCRVKQQPTKQDIHVCLLQLDEGTESGHVGHPERRGKVAAVLFQVSEKAITPTPGLHVAINDALVGELVGLPVWPTLFSPLTISR